MVRCLARDTTAGSVLFRRQLAPQMLLVDHLLRASLFLLQHYVQRRGGGGGGVAGIFISFHFIPYREPLLGSSTPSVPTLHPRMSPHTVSHYSPRALLPLPHIPLPEPPPPSSPGPPYAYAQSTAAPNRALNYAEPCSTPVVRLDHRHSPYPWCFRPTCRHTACIGPSCHT